MVEVNNLTTFQINQKLLKEIAQKVLKGEKKEKIELSIALVGRTRIKELNQKYRKKNKPTDVLSFFYGDFGEIVICPEEVKKNAEMFDLIFQKELTKTLIHGILHLIGHDHENDRKKAEEMQRKEKNYLFQFKNKS